MGIHVLVVEDDERIGASIEQALKAAGYDATHVLTGEEAFFLATTQRFDLLVLDLGLPGRDGLEVLQARALRTRRRHDRSTSEGISKLGASGQQRSAQGRTDFYSS